MIIKFSPVRLSIIFLLVILFPFVQKQWLNLYLFDINNFTIYKLLYYLSGLSIPLLVIINSLSKFTFYKFNYPKQIKIEYINGKLLLLITSIILILLSTLILSYILLNFKIFLELFISNNNHQVSFYSDKQILFTVIISILLIFKKTKTVIKKTLLANYFIISIFIWYAQINNVLVTNINPIYNFKFNNLNYINIIFLLAIEILFYLWSYISCGSYLSDWSVPKPYKEEITPIFSILFFYFLIIIYYSILI